MAIEFVRNIISSGYNLSKINDNFVSIATALQDALSRSGTSPNVMNADIDMDSNDLLNVNQLTTKTLVLNGVVIAPTATATYPVLVGTSTYDPPSLADGAGASTTVTVTGAVLGDVALASFSSSTQGIIVTASVTAVNTVTIRFQNETGGTIDLPSGTLKAVVIK